MCEAMLKAWRRACTAEVCWSTPQGPRAMSVVPLVWPKDGTLCAAVPLSRLAALDSVPAAAAFSVHGNDATEQTLVAAGRVETRFDLEGEDFVEHLLAQEVAKHPPTRLRADSLMARRENWWWIPRVLVTLTGMDRVRALPPRNGPRDALLVRQQADSGGLLPAPHVTVVTADRWPEPAETGWIELRACAADRLGGDGEGAFVFGHRHSPDFERWERWYRSGTMHGGALRTSSGEGAPLPGDERAGGAEPFSLVQRAFQHRRVAKACKRGIAVAERRTR